MEPKILKALIVLGVPGVALGVFFLLLRGFNFRFSEINATWAPIIAIIFVVGVVVTIIFALHRFAPATPQAQDDGLQRKKMERVETRREAWLQEALNHAEEVLRHIEGARATAIQEVGLMEPDRVQIAILEALSPEYSPDKLKVVEALNDDALKSVLANVQEAFRAVRIAQMDLAHGVPPQSEDYEPTYVVQWYATQLTNFESVARRLLGGT
jgi:hypothetical protein